MQFSEKCILSRPLTKLSQTKSCESETYKLEDAFISCGGKTPRACVRIHSFEWFLKEFQVMKGNTFVIFLCKN